MAFCGVSLIYYYCLHLKHLLNSVTMTIHFLCEWILNSNWAEKRWLDLLKSYLQVILWSCHVQRNICKEIINRGLLFSLQNINLRRHNEKTQASHKINSPKVGWKTVCIKCNSLTPKKCGSCAKPFSAGAEESCQVFARCSAHTSVKHGNQEE